MKKLFLIFGILISTAAAALAMQQGNQSIPGTGAGTTSQIGSATTRVIYATDPIYAGGAKFNGHLFEANITNGNPKLPTSGTLLETDGVTAYNPLTSGVKANDLVECLSGFSSGNPLPIELVVSKVLSVTSAYMTVDHNANATVTPAYCVTGTDDTLAIDAAKSAALTPGHCGVLVMPAGYGLITSSPFISNPANAACGIFLFGQGGGQPTGYARPQSPAGTTLIPMNNFNFLTGPNGETNLARAVVGSDTTNLPGLMQNFNVDALGGVFTDTTNDSKVGLFFSFQNVFNVGIFGFWPTNSTAPPAAFFMGNGNSPSCDTCTADGDALAMYCHANQPGVLTNSKFGNNGQNLELDGCGSDSGTFLTVHGGWWDEESNVGEPVTGGKSAISINSHSHLHLTDISMLGVQNGGSNFTVSVDGTSELIASGAMVAAGPDPAQALSIASGGLVRAVNSQFASSSATLASVVNLGTFIDGGGNRCYTGALVANNSGGTVPGTCIANSGNAAISSLSHSVTNFTEGAVNLAASSIGTWTPSQNITVERIEAANTAGNVTCATPLVLSLQNGTTTINLTLTSGQSSWDSGAIQTTATGYVSGTAITLKQTAAPAVCATPPVNLNVSITWEPLP